MELTLVLVLIGFIIAATIALLIVDALSHRLARMLVAGAGRVRDLVAGSRRASADRRA